MGAKFNHSRIKDKGDLDLLDKSLVVRFNKEDLKKRFLFVSEMGACQVCDYMKQLDYPHHAKYGLGSKDDRYLINICLDCHLEIHSGSYSNLNKTREQLEVIGWENHLEYIENT